MNKTIINIIPDRLFYFIIWICFSSTALPQSSLFLKTFSSTPNYTVFQMPYSGIDTLSQNSFITGGHKMRWSNGTGDTLLLDSYLQKTEISGLTKWFRNYHLNGYNLTFKDLKILPNKDILVGGSTNDYFDPNPNSKHGTLLRTDSNGYVKWFRLYRLQKIHKLLLFKNGNIGVLASDSGSFYGKALKLSLLNQAGNLIWCKKILPVDTNGYNAVDLVEGKNKSVLIVGYHLVSTAKSFLILVDSLGNKINDVSLNLPTNYPRHIWKAINYFDEGFYAVGTSQGNASNITGSIMRLDNSLNVLWYKLLQTQTGNSEFYDITAISRNNLMILNEPENYGYMPDLQRTGLTFIDSNGVARKNFLFTTDSVPIIPSRFLLLKNGNVLFSAANNAQYFGITDTLSNGFCKYTPITYPIISNTQSYTFNSFSTINSTFNYSLTSLYVYQPFDLQINYYCSSGPTGSLDTTNSAINVRSYEKQNNYKIFPNPANDFIIIGSTSIENKNYLYKSKIRLINSMGQTVFSNLILVFEQYVKIDIKNYNDGIYSLEIESVNEERFNKRIIISR